MFIIQGGFSIEKENQKNKSTIYENSDCFAFHGLEQIFHSEVKKNSSYPKFTPKRIIVIQMENEIIEIN